MTTATRTLDASGVQWASSKAVAEKILRQRPGVMDVSVNPVSQTATVTYDTAITDVGELAQWIRDCGLHCAGESLPDHLCDVEAAPAAGHDGHAHHVTEAPASHTEHYGRVCSTVDLPRGGHCGTVTPYRRCLVGQDRVKIVLHQTLTQRPPFHRSPATRLARTSTGSSRARRTDVGGRSTRGEDGSGPASACRRWARCAAGPRIGDGGRLYGLRRSRGGHRAGPGTGARPADAGGRGT